MDHELAYKILSERSVQYLDQIRTEAKEKPQGKRFLLVVWFLLGISFASVLNWAFSFISYDTEIETFISKALVFAVLVVITISLAWLVAYPIEKLLRDKLELIEKIEDEVLYRAMNEAYDEAKVAK